MARRSQASLPTVLVTGFEPFGGQAVNPSAEIARQLHGTVIQGHRVVGALLPCVFGAARRELQAHIRAARPVLVICTGQAAGRAGLTPERVAVNLDDAPQPDNAGQQPVDRPIVRGGPPAYFSTLPVKAITAALLDHGNPASVSLSAGTYVCNHVFYALMHGLAGSRRGGRAVRGGFIHVPLLPEQAKSGQASLPLEAITAGLALAISTALRVRRDRRMPLGRTH